MYLYGIFARAPCVYVNIIFFYQPFIYTFLWGAHLINKIKTRTQTLSHFTSSFTYSTRFIVLLCLQVSGWLAGDKMNLLKDDEGNDIIFLSVIVLLRLPISKTHLATEKSVFFISVRSISTTKKKNRECQNSCNISEIALSSECNSFENNRNH